MGRGAAELVAGLSELVVGLSELFLDRLDFCWDFSMFSLDCSLSPDPEELDEGTCG